MKFLKVFNFSLLLLIFSINLSAQTIFKSGIISTHVEWSDTIKVIGNIDIVQNGELIINPGTFIEFQNQYKISIKSNGKIEANGNVNDSITFICSDKNIGWSGIRFDSMQISSDSSIFNYCKISYYKYTNRQYSLSGAIDINNYDKIRFSNCKFSNNYNWSDGGAILVDSSDIKIINCNFNNNSSGFYGGALYIENSNPIVRNSSFKYNKSPFGVAMYIKRSNPIITNCEIINNNYSSEAIWFRDSKGLIINSKIQNNNSVGISLSSSDVTIINSLIANNNNGGFYITTCNPSIINSTIVNNLGYGGIRSWESKIVIKNSILWNSSRPNSIEISFTKYPQIISSNIINGGLLKIPDSLYINNINEDPKFVFPIDAVGIDASALIANWNIKSCSPCVNKGNNSLLPDSINYDLIDLPRIYNDTIDIGAYELQEQKIQMQGRKRLYVKEGGTGTGNSWSDALGNLQDAINYPLNCHTAIDIWLAKGIYYPDTSGLVDKHKASFNLRNNVAIYGGFIGNEISIQQRDIGSNLTVLSGNYGKTEDASGRSYTVIKSIYLDSTAVIDGVSIADGYFYSFFSNGEGGGVYMSNSNMILSNSIIQNNVSLNGGGIYLDNSNPSIINTIIQDNRADYGGGVYLWKSNPSIINSNIFSNKAKYGAGSYISYSNPYFQSTKIINNSSFEGGGGMILLSSNPKIVNSIIANNAVEYGLGVGGGIYCSSSNPTILNSLIANNKSGYLGAGIYSMYSSPSIINTIVWDNYDRFGLSQFFSLNDYIGAKFINCNIKGGNQFGINSNYYLNNIDNYPRFINSSLIVGVSNDGLLANWSTNSCSPCINKGTQSIESIAIPMKDLAGFDRIYNDTIDIGPYEFNSQKTALIDNQIIYVKPDGNGNGLSWNDALSNIQIAIDPPLGCYDKREVWVAKGTYFPDTIGLNDHREASFKPRSNVKIYGGFIGNEETMVNRDLNQNQTILSGDIGILDTYLDNSYHVVLCENNDSTSILDGFIIEKGNASEFISEGNGGGIKCKNSESIFKNLIVRDNQSVRDGGGMYFESSSTSISNSVISNNNKGGIYSYFSNVTILNSEITNNLDGKGIYAGVSNLYLFNDKIINNSGDVGGVYLSNAYSGIVNCLIANNSGYWSDGGIKSENSKSTIINSTIVNNYSMNYGAGGIGSYYNDTILIANSIVWNNYGALGNDLYKTGTNGKTIILNSDIKNGNVLNLQEQDYQNNINSLPYFVNPTTDIGTSINAFTADWRIGLNSPCIDKGLNYNILYFIGKDVYGNPRIINNIVDIGACESQGSTNDINIIEVEPQGDFILFPNPTNDFITVQNKNVINSFIEINIISMNGESIKSTSYFMNKSVKIDVRNLRSGLYLIQIIYNDNKQISKRFIKN